MEKKKVSLKLSLNKEEVVNLTNEEMSSFRGGEAPTYVDTPHGGYCTQDWLACNATIGDQNCSFGCTGPCPSSAETGCDNGSHIDCGVSLLGTCFTDFQCTNAQCTAGCPHSYNDATCTCTPAGC